MKRSWLRSMTKRIEVLKRKEKDIDYLDIDGEDSYIDRLRRKDRTWIELERLHARAEDQG